MKLAFKGLDINNGVFFFFSTQLANIYPRIKYVLVKVFIRYLVSLTGY